MKSINHSLIKINDCLDKIQGRADVDTNWEKQLNEIKRQIDEFSQNIIELKAKLKKIMYSFRCDLDVDNLENATNAFCGAIDVFKGKKLFTKVDGLKKQIDDRFEIQKTTIQHPSEG